MERPQDALDAVLALDRAVTLASARTRQGRSEAGQGLLFHWSEIAEGRWRDERPGRMCV